MKSARSDTAPAVDSSFSRRRQAERPLVEHDGSAMVVEGGHLLAVAGDHVHALETSSSPCRGSRRSGWRRRTTPPGTAACPGRRSAPARGPNSASIGRMFSSPSSGDRVNRLTPIVQELTRGHAVDRVHRPVRRQIDVARTLRCRIEAEIAPRRQVGRLPAAPARRAQTMRSCAAGRCSSHFRVKGGSASRMRSRPIMPGETVEPFRQDGGMIAGNVDDRPHRRPPSRPR